MDLVGRNRPRNRSPHPSPQPGGSAGLVGPHLGHTAGGDYWGSAGSGSPGGNLSATVGLAGSDAAAVCLRRGLATFWRGGAFPLLAAPPPAQQPSISGSPAARAEKLDPSGAGLRGGVGVGSTSAGTGGGGFGCRIRLAGAGKQPFSGRKGHFGLRLALLATPQGRLASPGTDGDHHFALPFCGRPKGGRTGAISATHPAGLVSSVPFAGGCCPVATGRRASAARL